MKIPFWNSVGNVYWRRVALCFTAGAGAWALFAAVVPLRLHLWVTAILGGGSVGLGIMIRGVKWANNREAEVPKDMT